MNIRLRWDANPIIIKEIRSGMRGYRPFAILTIVLLLMGGLSYLLFKIVAVSASYSQSAISPQIGQAIFVGLVFFELFTICALSPALTSSAVSSEREKGTFEMLILTPLNPVRLLWGKLLASLSYVFLVLLAAIPMSSLIFTFGGVDFWTILKSLLVLISSTFLFGMIGLFCSSFIKHSSRAAAVSYFLVVLLLIGPIIIAAIPSMLYNRSPERWLMAFSPISALTSALRPTIGHQTYASMYFYYFLGSLPDLLAYTPFSSTSIPRPIYHLSIPIYGLITLLLFLISSRLLRPVRRWRLRWTEWLLASILILGYLGIIGMFYAGTTNRYEGAVNTSPTVIPPVEILPVPSLKGP